MQLSTDDHPALALLPECPTQTEIEAFAHFLQARSPDGVDLQTRHIVNADLYARPIVLSAESFLVGLAHKQPGIAISVGDITIWTEDGSRRYTGAHVLPTVAGKMRIGFAHAETSWITVHANKTGTLDIETIEDSLVEHPERLMTRRNLLKVAA